MNLESIPKSFWHALSLAVLVMTTAFALVTYRAGNYSLKYEGLELSASHAQEVIAGAQDDLRNAAADHLRKVDEWEKEKRALQLALADAQKQIENLTAAKASATDPDFANDLKKLKEQLVLAKPRLESASTKAAEEKLFEYTTTSPAPKPVITGAKPVATPEVKINPVQSKIDQLDRIRQQLRAKE